MKDLCYFCGKEKKIYKNDPKDVDIAYCKSCYKKMFIICEDCKRVTESKDIFKVGLFKKVCIHCVDKYMKIRNK